MTQSLKVALIRARYNPYGGAEQFAMRAMQALASQGANITIIARRWSGVSEQSKGVRLLRCDPYYIGSLWRDIAFARAATRMVKSESFDLVQSHERIAGLPIYRAGDGVHAAWLERRAAQMNLFGRIGLKLNGHHRWLLYTERRMFQHPDLRAVICNSKMVRDEILQRFRISADKLHVIGNGVDLERFHPSVREKYRTELRQQLNIPTEAPVFLLVGSGFERKGVATALRALARANINQSVPARLVIVGGDKNLHRYRKLVQQLDLANRVLFVGEKPDPLPWYGMADAFILPTLYDPFPNAALEALACGLPVITSDACGAKEVVSRQCGWICGASNVSAHADAMAQFISARHIPEQALALRTAARQAAEPYSLANLGQALQGLYQQLLAKK